MPSEAAEILARALELDAEAQERGELDNIGMQYDEVLGQILPIDDIPDQVFNMAFGFWSDWLDAKNHNWLHHEPMTKSDWPKVARIIAQSVRELTIPSDPTIQKLFLPAPKAPRTSLFQRIKACFRRSA
jgi:hypothetical protein